MTDTTTTRGRRALPWTRRRTRSDAIKLFRGYGGHRRLHTRFGMFSYIPARHPLPGASIR